MIVDTLVIHYTGMRDAASALARLRDPIAAVSSHWLVDEDGSVIALVPERRRAWHAGISGWQGRIGLNASSIGIELVNPGHEWGYRPFPERQIEAVERLCRGILARWPIPPARILGHADIAPHRKQDPGEAFPWRWLAQRGIGKWPKPRDLDHDPEVALQVIGYPLGLEGVTVQLAVEAFQRRYRPSRVDGVVDLETAALIAGVERLQVT
jgi:N-acetylmuramoyl-L-alanine amidase